MAPSIATRQGRPVLALGTPGSYGICQTQSQAMVQHVDFGLGLQEAIEAPRARLFDGRSMLVESRLDDKTLDALRARGHAIEIGAPWTMTVGGMQGIAIDSATGAFTGTVNRAIRRSLLQRFERRHAELALGLIDVALGALSNQNRGNVLCEAEILRWQGAACSRISLGLLSRRFRFLPFLRRSRESGDQTNDDCAGYKMCPALDTTISKISLLHARRAPQSG